MLEEIYNKIIFEEQYPTLFKKLCEHIKPYVNARNTKEDIIDMSAGIILNANVGDYVKKGSALAYLQSSTVADQSAAQNRFIQSLTFSQSAPAAEPLVYEIIT